jgi:hypothetical protein
MTSSLTWIRHWLVIDNGINAMQNTASGRCFYVNSQEKKKQEKRLRRVSDIPTWIC